MLLAIIVITKKFLIMLTVVIKFVEQKNGFCEKNCTFNLIK